MQENLASLISVLVDWDGLALHFTRFPYSFLVSSR